MVSPTSTTSQTPALSYAESAKKAQGVKPTSQHTQKPLSVPPRQPPAPVLESKKAGPSSPIVETTLTSPVDLSLNDAPSSSANPPAPSESTSHSSTTLTIDSITTGVVPSTSAKVVPKPNVWNQRIQQRAQTRSQPRPPQSLPQMTQSHVLRVPSPPRDPSSPSSGSRQPDVPVSAGVRSDIPASPSGLNGASGASSTSSPSTGTTPSSRREPLPHPPPVEDAESWPEVGKCQTSAGKSLRVSNGYTGPVEAKDVEEKDSDGLSSSHPGTPRKGEKTKWIVIPPEELQATADSLNPPRSYAHSRSHSQLGARNSHTRNVAGSGSVQGSQAPSKTASGRTSSSHSRAHSPSSMASSPQHPGRGRQLPVEVRGAQAPDQQQPQQQSPPPGNSPRAYADMALSTPVPYGRITRDVYAYGNLPSQSTSTQTFIPQQPPAPAQPPPPPPTHYPPALQLNPTHTQQPYTPSSVSPYPQPYPLHTPSDRYGPAPTQPLPPGWAAPEHYVYPYGYPPYGQPHPMMYWPSNMPLDMRQDGHAMYPSYPPVQPQQIVPPPHVSEDDGAPSVGEEPATHPALPLPTMIARPPPPQESDAVAGYRAVKPILEARSGWEEPTRGRRDMIFGSVGAPGESKSPSPSPRPSASEAQPAAIDSQPVNEKSERAVATFSIGVSPGEAGPSHARSRTRSQPRLSRADNLSDGKSSEPHPASDVKVIDLTSSETKWEFGTANLPQDEHIQDDKSRPELVEPQDPSQAPPAPSKAALDVSLLFSGPLQEPLLPVVPTESPLAELHHPYPQPHHHLPYALPQHIHAPPPPPPQDELQLQTGPGPYPVHQPPPQPPSGSSADGFEVKDFGYGFGRASGTGHVVPSMREDRVVREREWERNRDPEREPYAWRPRRGSYSGHHERGGYSGRRVRGGPNGFGRGTSGRGFPRGGFRQHQQRHQHQQQHQQQHQHQHQHQHQQHQHQQPQPQQQQQQAQQQQVPPFTATPPSQAFQPLQPPSPPRPVADVGQYLPTAIQQPYMPHGFDAYQGPVPLSYPPPPNASMPSSVSVHPVPRPLSNITYSAADPTRFFLLGQLEYYLSAQNMASDLFLRQRMDSRGWIPVSLLASFNRVRQLTLDPQLVRDVLALSSIVELCDDCVRMGGGEWRRFVLPDAPTSTVEFEGAEAEENRIGVDRYQDDHDQYADVEEEEEEEEIEIVMDRELGPTWTTPST